MSMETSIALDPKIRDTGLIEAACRRLGWSCTRPAPDVFRIWPSVGAESQTNVFLIRSYDLGPFIPVWDRNLPELTAAMGGLEADRFLQAYSIEKLLRDLLKGGLAITDIVRRTDEILIRFDAACR